MTKVWEWLKKNWKWLVLPLWALSLLLMWFIGGGKRPFLPPSGTSDKAAEEALAAKDKAIADFRAKLDELLKKYEERLKAASAEQAAEFKEKHNAPLDEVSKWIDGL